jgi:uridine phosphorylase
VISELIELGARRLVRVGTCGALAPGLRLGDLVIATEAIAADGTSRALGSGERVPASPALLDALAGAGDRAGPVVSTDLFYDRRGLERGWAEEGALAVEMEAATLFALAAARDVQASALLVVSDLVLPERARIGPDDLREAERRMGRAALRAFSLVGEPQP